LNKILVILKLEDLLVSSKDLDSAYSVPDSKQQIENIDNEKILILRSYLGFDNENDLISYLKLYFVE
jgi:hypothetical protein